MRRAAVVALVVLSTAGCIPHSRMDRAISIANNPGSYATAPKAAASMAKIAVLLRADGRLEASAFVQVLAVAILDCTAAERAETRRPTVNYLRALRRGDRRPTIPTIPRC